MQEEKFEPTKYFLIVQHDNHVKLIYFFVTEKPQRKSVIMIDKIKWTVASVPSHRLAMILHGAYLLSEGRILDLFDFKIL